jgi:general secretion pathway protein D
VATLLRVVLLSIVVAGCAAQRLQREGQELIASGQYEQGLAKLAESSRAEPGNLGYRSALMRHRDMALGRLQADADAARTGGKPDAARAAFDSMLRIDSANKNARTGLAALEMDGRHRQLLDEAAKALEHDDAVSARALLGRVLLENPDNASARQLQRRVDERLAGAMADGPALGAKFRKPVSLQFRDANIKMVFEGIARASGVNILLDKDVKPDTKVSIFVQDVSVEDAIALILLQSQLEKKVISDNTLLIYQNIPAKVKEYQDLKIRSFHLVNADAKQIQAMIKTLLKTRDIVVHEKTNSVVMRDTPEAVELAARLVEDQDLADPEVMLEVEVLEVSGSRLSDIGMGLPTSLSLSVPGGAGLTLDALRHTRAGSLAVSPAPSVTLNMLMQDGDSNLLASPRIRARNHEKAKIMIGDRVPVITNAVTPVSTGTPVVTGNVQYLDVGLKLEVEPDIHLDDEVSIKVNLEVSSIVKEVQNLQSGTLAYQVGTRNATTVLRLKDGETQILGGLINDEDRNSASRIPGLGQLPLLGRLFSSHKDDKRKTEILLSITPHVIGGRRLADARRTEYWSGSEANLRSGPLMQRALGKVAAGAPGRPMAPTVAAAAPSLPGPAAPDVAPPAAAPAAASPASQPLVLSWQAPSQVKAGERLSVTIAAQSSRPAHSLALALGFDPAVLRAVEVKEGDFMRQGQLASAFSQHIDQAGGKVALEVVARGDDGASGAGNVATVVFEALAAGATTTLNAGEVKAAAAGGEPLAVTASSAHALEVLP